MERSRADLPDAGAGAGEVRAAVSSAGPLHVNFVEALVVIGGVRQKIRFRCFDLLQSDPCFVNAYPQETTEAFLDGHVSAFAFFDSVPLSLLYDNVNIAVA